ncbi:poly(A) polymerase type 3-like [Toxotes jaculatrix]|uniref:poly(A) polymerase type 3-like n=1 Tax=Toxotes jaculatrix TaxID=941984 RepID=UPI001B3ADEFE|nr:poly(A) polymerase type 3-like [Toxotes jaculatrix]
MSGPRNSQDPLFPEIPKTYGITGPISEDLPEEEDLIQSRKLSESLKAYDIFEDDLQLRHRENVVKRLESVYKDWLKDMCEEMNLPEVVTDHVGGKIFPFGSFHLGAHTKGADIDALCVGPGFLERKDFFTSFYEKLKAQKEVTEIQAVEEAFVPVIKLCYDGTEVDLVFARLLQRSVPDNLKVCNDELLKNLDKLCVRSLNGYRVTEEILSLVPNVYNFRLALRTIKLWAKRHNIYSNKLGFLGGVSWAILVARVCQLFPNATASTLVTKFFKIYSMWVWSVPVCLREVKDCRYNLPFWDPRVNPSDRCHIMPIITPAYPQQNTSYNVSPSTFTIIMEEIKRGHAIAQEIQQGKATWSKLFETPEFFEKYQHYVLLKATSTTDKQHIGWTSLVESKIRLLVGILERNVNISLAHINLQMFPGPRKNNIEGVSTSWLIGLLLNSDGSKNQKIDLTSDLLSFTDAIYTQAKTSELYEEGMTVSAMYMQRENLCWQMPDGSRKKVFSPKPQPEVSHQISAPASHTAPDSACHPGAKRKGWPQSEMPAKKMKTDKESASVSTATPSSVTPQATKRPRSPCSDESTSKRIKPDPEPHEETKPTCHDESGVSLSKSPSPSKKRPGTPELETPTKKPRYDLNQPTVELSDQLPGPTKPVSVKKGSIKLHLVSRRN